ncbi:DUF5994 family protein [Nocardia sp. JMUB6875]
MPRVLMKRWAPKTGYVDGGWWPYSNDLMTELPGLITTVAAHFGPVLRVAYYLTDWDTPTRALSVAGKPVRLDWRGYSPAHTVELSGLRGHRLVVLVVPPETSATDACSAITAAATTNGTPTVNDLLRTGNRCRRERTERRTAARRWADRTTTPN